MSGLTERITESPRGDNKGYQRRRYLEEVRIKLASGEWSLVPSKATIDQINEVSFAHPEDIESIYNCLVEKGRFVAMTEGK